MELHAIKLSPAARALVDERLVFDAHADSLQRALDLGHDLGVRGPGHLDLERGAQGGLGALVCVCWVDPKHIQEGAGASRRRTFALLERFHRLVERHPARVGFAGNARMLAACRSRRAVGGIPGIEGGHSIEEDLRTLERFFEHGVRVLTLVWNNHLSWVRSCQEGAGAGVPAGLSGFGREVVRSMNALGMVVDLSHAGRRSFYDALETSTRPVIASHSGCRAVSEHQRNLDDEQLRALAGNGGVVGMVFCTAFLDEAARAEEARVRDSDAWRALAGSNDTDLFLRQSELLQRAAAPLPAERLLDHLVHAVEVAGVDHVGLGSDFDGILRTPAGLEDASCYGVLAELMLRRGFQPEEIRKVLGQNMERVFAAVTAPGTRAASAALSPLDRAHPELAGAVVGAHP